uniref:Si:dkey-35i13.1 n=1 Tax=Cyclopterus lumpus TaxID=8103 RepID=A0A8C3G3I0_CYCLU
GRCHRANNGTCAEHLSFFPPFSSTLALLVLVAVLVGIVLVSLATFHFHKRKLRKRKIQRAQEEYERDSRSPARGAGAGAGRPCVIVRPYLPALTFGPLPLSQPKTLFKPQRCLNFKFFLRCDTQLCSII